MATAFCCDFRQANLENSSFTRADLRGSRFAGAVLVGANMFEADLREGGQVSRDRKGEFHAHGGSAVDFKGANLTNATLGRVMAVRTDFSDATMRGTKLVRAHLQGANFTNCDLEAADFGQADMREACFRGAVLSHANFEFADIAGADMQDTLSDKPHGRPIDELLVSLEELHRQHEQFLGSHGAEGALLDVSGFDLRGSGSWAGVCLTMAMARSRKTLMLCQDVQCFQIFKSVTSSSVEAHSKQIASRAASQCGHLATLSLCNRVPLRHARTPVTGES
jgi:hypothetical protein